MIFHQINMELVVEVESRQAAAAVEPTTDKPVPTESDRRTPNRPCKPWLMGYTVHTEVPVLGTLTTMCLNGTPMHRQMDLDSTIGLVSSSALYPIGSACPVVQQPCQHLRPWGCLGGE